SRPSWPTPILARAAVTPGTGSPCPCRADAPSGATRLEGAPDHVDPIGLDHVIDLDVIEVGDLDAAFEALADLLDVVLEPLQRLERSLVDLAPFADQA